MPYKDPAIRRLKQKGYTAKYFSKPEKLAKKRVSKRTRTDKHLKYLDAIKSVPCADCKGTFPAICMDFDHLPEFEKVADVSRLSTYSLDVIMKEVSKCQVVCSNCHRVRTKNREQYATRNRR